MSLSRGSLDPSRQGAKGTSCRTARAPEPVGIKCGCIKSQAEGCPWAVTAVELQEAGERNEAIHPYLLQATELKMAGCGLHCFFLSCFQTAQVPAATQKQLNPLVSPGVTLDKNSEDHVSRCLFFSWLA